MKRAEIMLKLADEIKAEMVRIYCDWLPMYSVIYVTESGEMKTHEFLSENSWLLQPDDGQVYPVFGMNPVNRFGEYEYPSDDVLNEWAETEFQASLYWAKCADLDEEEESEE